MRCAETAEEDKLPTYFTDRKDLCEKLQRAALASKLEPKRIFNIHSAAGSGKSAVLRMFYIFCKGNGIPVALVSGSRKLTEIEVMRRLAAGLEESQIKLRAFQAILKKLDTQQRPGDENLLDQGVEAGTKLAAAAGEVPSFLVCLVAKFISALGSVLKFAVSFGRARARRQLQDPVATITGKFLEETAKHAKSHRLVVMLDHYEEMDDLEVWLCDWLRRLHPNVLVLVAGQPLLGGTSWARTWPGWEFNVQFETLEPLGDADRRQMVVSLYKSMRGVEPSTDLVDEILACRVQSPLALWVEVLVRHWGYRGPAKLADDGTIEAIVEFFLHGLSDDLKKIVEAAATVRFFDQEVLRKLVGESGLQSHAEHLTDLRGLLVKSKDGWTFPRSFREVMNFHLRQNDRGRYEALHEKARDCYRQRLKHLEGTKRQTLEERRETQKWEQERLYHEFQLSESRGMQEFRAVFDAAFHQRGELDFCRSLTCDATDYTIDASNQAWLALYKALVAIQSGDLKEARRILENLRKQRLPWDLESNVFESFGEVLWLQGHIAHARQVHEEYLTICKSQEDLVGQAKVLISLANLYKRTGKAEQYLRRAQEICEKLTDEEGHVKARLNRELADSCRLQGKFHEAEDFIAKSIESYHKLERKFEEAHAIRTRAMLLVYTGKLREAKRLFLDCIRKFEEYSPGGPRLFERVWPLIGLGDVALGEGNHDDSQKHYEDALRICEGSEFETAVLQGCLADLYCAKREWATSIFYADQSLVLRKKHQDIFGMGLAMNTKGRSLLGAGSLKEALNTFEEGLRIMQEWGSFYVQSKLTLGKCEAHCRRGEFDAFEEAAETVRKWGEQYEYWDLLARLYFLEGSIALRRPVAMDDSRPTINRLELGGTKFLNAMRCALRQNIFQLDALTRDVREEVWKLPDAADQEEVFSYLKKSWRVEKIGDNALAVIESLERSEYGADSEDFEVVKQLNIQARFGASVGGRGT